jgi:hypothetical protein
VSDYVYADYTCADCGKQGWHGKQRARSVLRAMRRRHGNARVLRIYPGCRGGFHIGNSERVLRDRPNLNDPRLRSAPST